MRLAVGSRGDLVENVQRFLRLVDDGIYGKNTQAAVKKWEYNKGRPVDGIVDEKDYEAMGFVSSDDSERLFKTSEGLVINRRYLDKGEYVKESNPKDIIFLHHTSGWDNPYDQVHGWNNDNRGRVGTAYIIGGINPCTLRKDYDGEVVEAFDPQYHAWHLGSVLSREYLTEYSIGIELCSMGKLERVGYRQYETWTGKRVKFSQVGKLEKPFNGALYYHKYSDEQVESTRKLILHLSERFDIDICSGLVDLIGRNGPELGLSYSKDASRGNIKGILSHTNVRRDKTDIIPQPEIINMLLNL